ncbi:terminase small subunit [Mucilaginibacter sp. OK098]|uniref:terminase small subunit n=1 Tax=Mucilaginibacter sp. OK098 TaxID=1855297 RepID=UPI000912C49E|nr:terminase small subunit [Mucilaginibacter sp. OK098]SHM51292.1 PEP-CTERM protein-sorting domain-containing protein [Mucilaginibacter sp. OK098]
MFPPCFTDQHNLALRIDAYFNFIEGEYHLETKPGKETKEQPAPTQKVWDRDPEPATLAGLALSLGFNSLMAFDDYMENGEFAEVLKWAHLRIEASYEKKLHAQSAAGAIFALKNMGWNERKEIKPAEEQSHVLAVQVFESGPTPAESEKEVIL